MSLPKFLIYNLLVVLVFPLGIFALDIAFFFAVGFNDTPITMAVGLFATVHVAIVWTGLYKHGHAGRVAIASLLAALAIFFYNRHWLGQLDDSPFSDGIGMVDQRAFGVFAWFRVFDEPFDPFGHTYTDWIAFFLNAELWVGATVVISIILWFLARRLKPAGDE